MTAGGRRAQNLSEPLHVGFVPLCDCAPLVMAQELGLFEKFGLRVRLSREVGWATVRDKMIHRELDAAHALAPMVFAVSLGLGSLQTDCVSGLVLSRSGSIESGSSSESRSSTPRIISCSAPGCTRTDWLRGGMCDWSLCRRPKWLRIYGPATSTAIASASRGIQRRPSGVSAGAPRRAWISRRIIRKKS